ncbi:hypothetical protein [Subtercola sp. YIM 133946]|uniref:hypothetical protein n=1 Tax=Subtercola sp. YIM 133946 TaxID=3118909 RepID=UPI002F93A529
MTTADTAAPMPVRDSSSDSPAERAPGRPLTGLRMLDARITTIAFWVLLAVGFGLRILLTFTTAYTIDSDNAVVFLVAKHISEGDIAWFFWGQTYGGTMLEFVAGAAMLVFGPHVQVLAIVGALFFAASAVLVRQIAVGAFVSPTVGNVAGVLFWFSGYWTARVGTSEPGFYGPSLMLGLLAIWLVLRGDRRKSYLQWALIGLVAGLALWQSPMGIALAAPAVLVLMVRHRSWRHYLVGVAAGIVGALPWLLLFAHGLSAVKPQATGNGVLVQSFTTFFTRLMPGAFSIEVPVARYVFALVCVLLLALLVVLTVLQRNLWLGTLVVSTAAVLVVIVVGTGILLQADSLRYTVFVLPALTIALAWLVTRLPFVGLVAMALAITFSVVQTTTMFPTLKFSSQPTYLVGDIPALGNYLEEHGITAAYGDYWLAYSVSAETDERAMVAAVSGPRRYPPYEAAAAAAPVATVIVFVGNQNDLAMQASTTLPPSTRTVVADYAIYTFDQPFDAYTYPWALY